MALAGFGIDSVIEIGASSVVLWELAQVEPARRQRALRLIGAAFVGLAAYLAVQSAVALVAQHHARHSDVGIAWTASTAVVMFALAAAKSRTGRVLDNRVLLAEGRVTFVDGVLAVAVLLGLAVNARLGWWWADPAAGLVIAGYAGKEARELLSDRPLEGAEWAQPPET